MGKTVQDIPFYIDILDRLVEDLKPILWFSEDPADFNQPAFMKMLKMDYMIQTVM